MKEEKIMLHQQTKWAAFAALVVSLFTFSAGPVWAQMPKAGNPAVKAALTEPVNVNKADSEELQKVKGIGPALAERIIHYRDSNGGNFKALDELKEVRGIGDAKFEKIKSNITI